MVSGLSIEEISYKNKDLIFVGIAAVITGLLLVFLELGKDAVGKVFIDIYLKESRFLYVAGLFLVVIISFSVASSTNGGLVVAEYQNRVKPEEISDLSSISANWSDKISQERAEIASLRKDPKNLVREGSNMVLGWNIRETIQAKEARVDKYLSLMDKEQGRAHTKNQEVKLMSSIDVEQYRTVALIVSVAVEIGIIFLLIFIRRFFYMTFKEIGLREDKEEAKKANSSPTLSDNRRVSQVKEPAKNGKIIPGASTKKMTIQDPGSEPGSLAKIRGLVNFNDPIQSKEYSKLLNYADVVASNDAGLSIAAIAKEHGISEGTVKNIRKILKKYAENTKAVIS
jgi:hypothetical protein